MSKRLTALLALPIGFLPFTALHAQEPAGSPAAPAGTSADAPSHKLSDADESKLKENLRLLGDLDGTWNFTLKSWPHGDAGSKPEELKGVATHNSLIGGWYYNMELKGKFPMPSGKSRDVQFDDIETYDIRKQKFVSTWFANAGSPSIMMVEGTYDATSKTFTYSGQESTGKIITQIFTLTDKDHMTADWFEDRGGQEVKTLQIDYTRKK